MSTRHYARKADSGCETVQGPPLGAVDLVRFRNRYQLYVRWKMSTRHYARKADSGCETVQGPRHPAVVVISAGDDRTDSKHTSGMPGWEGAALKGRLTAIEERVVKRSSGGNITRSFSASDRLDRKVNHSAVSVSLPRE